MIWNNLDNKKLAETNKKFLQKNKKNNHETKYYTYTT